MSLEGKKCPAFSRDATGNITLSNEDFNQKNLIIFFYPKDNTPGCTTEAKDFSNKIKQFKKLNTEIIGVSKEGIINKRFWNFIPYPIFKCIENNSRDVFSGAGLSFSKSL